MTGPGCQQADGPQRDSHQGTGISWHPPQQGAAQYLLQVRLLRMCPPASLLCQPTSLTACIEPRAPGQEQLPDLLAGLGCSKKKTGGVGISSMQPLTNLDEKMIMRILQASTAHHELQQIAQAH